MPLSLSLSLSKGNSKYQWNFLNISVPAEHYVSNKQKKVSNTLQSYTNWYVRADRKMPDRARSEIIPILQRKSPVRLCLPGELVSSFIPLLINHQFGQKFSSN
jgi:hypothetical protein